MKICLLREEHISQICMIENMFLSPWSAQAVAQEIDRPDGLALVLVDESDDRVTGWCCARYIDDESELLKIAVLPERQRQGLGEQLLNALIIALRARSVVTQYLEVREQNHQAVAFYKKFGFQNIGRRARYYTDPSDTALLFRKQLITI